MTNSGGRTAEVRGWKSEIRDRRLENRGWGAGCTEERAQIRVRQHGKNKDSRGAKSGSTATLGCAGMFHIRRTGRSACATEPMTHPRSLVHAAFGYVPFGYAQGRWDRCARMGAPVRALTGTGEDGGIAARLLLINCAN